MEWDGIKDFCGVQYGMEQKVDSILYTKYGMVWNENFLVCIVWYGIEKKYGINTAQKLSF